MTDKRPSSAKLRRNCFSAHRKEDGWGTYMECHICGGRINPALDKWEAEHVIRRVLSQNDSTDNLMPVHTFCHKEKTRVDVRENAKGKDASDKHFGVKRKGWGGKWKKKLSGEVVER
jgi:hypothetical protein